MKKFFITILLIISAVLIILLARKIITINNIQKQNSYIVKNTDKNIFKNELLENVVNRLKNITNEEKIKSSDFSLIKYDNKSYFKINITDIANSDFLIRYEGINVTELYANISAINENNIDKVNSIMISLIMASDLTIDKKTANQIIAKLSNDLKSDNLKSVIKYSNGIIYSLEIADNNFIILSAK